MKKWLKTATMLATFFLLAACRGNQTADSENAFTPSKSSETTDAQSGASEKEYTDPSELNDNYDIVIVGAGGAGLAWQLRSKPKKLERILSF